MRLRSSEGNEVVLLHNLLDISGGACPQPQASGKTPESSQHLLFNGEIYNYRDFSEEKSDTLCLLPLFQKHGTGLSSLLDGEFAICIYDTPNETLHVFTDPFMTKPVFFGFGPTNSDFGVATCASSLRMTGFKTIEPASPNTSYHVCFRSNQITIDKTFPVVQFDLNQHKTNFEDWTNAFYASVRKRAKHGAHRPIVFLSSGFDSGAICLALNELNVKYDTFSIVAGENVEILQQRVKYNKLHSCENAFLYQGISAREKRKIVRDIGRNVEPFDYVHEDGPGFIQNLITDSGAIGGNFLAKKARENQRLVNLSGSGADEIMSDYGLHGTKLYYHSEFGGLFPHDLSTLFPWRKFYGDTQRSYLFKEEYILGRHGIEGRYPFLDKSLVQEFLWLDVNLKNGAYKAPLTALFEKKRYPFEPSTKRGFVPMTSNRTLLQLTRQFIKRIL